MTPTDIEVRLRTALNELTDTTPLANPDHPPRGAMRGAVMTTGAPSQKRRPALLLVGLFAVVVIAAAVAFGVFYGQRSPVKGDHHALRPPLHKLHKYVRVPVGFEVAVNGQAATTPGATIPTGSNTPVTVPSGEQTAIDISVTVPSGSSLSNLEIGTGSQQGWGIAGGPTGVELLLLKSKVVYEGGTHQLLVTFPAQPPGSEYLYAYYHATPQPNSRQSDGWTVQQIAVLLVQA